MLELTTKYFGTVTYQEESVVLFPGGLPGFPDEKRFLLVEQALNKPIVFLQSLARFELCFLTLPVRGLQPDYELSIAAEDLRVLGLDEERQPAIGTEVACLAILSLSEDRPPTANLLSPVVINWKTRTAVQAVQIDSGYSHQHPLFAEEAVEACS